MKASSSSSSNNDDGTTSKNVIVRKEEGSSSNNNNSSSVLAFSLTTNKKKKRKTTAATLQDFTGGDENQKALKEQRRSSSPLVIPLPTMTEPASSKFSSLSLLLTRLKSSTTKTDDNDDDNDTDTAAAQHLIESARQHLGGKSSEGGGGQTNFSPDGTLTIAAATTTESSRRIQQQQGEAVNDDISNDVQQLQRDLERRADDVPVDSNIYHDVPISEFGAALLRGMGWTGTGTEGASGSNGGDSSTMRRPHRLGLGATPKLVAMTRSSRTTARDDGRRLRCPDQVERDKRLVQQQEEYEAKRLAHVRLDKQQTLQPGSIVDVVDVENDDGRRTETRRARMVQLLGVPGLNRVLVQYEGDTESTSVKKGSIQLISRSELDQRPFREQQAASIVEKQQHENVKKEEEDDDEQAHDDRHHHRRRDGKRIIKHEMDDGYSYSRNSEGDRKRIKREEDNAKSSNKWDRDQQVRREKEDRQRSRHKDGSSREKKDRKSSTDKKQRRRNDETDDHDTQHWLIANIRVRVVTKKLSSRQYKQKGLVLDVTHGGAYATLQMTDGQILDHVPERYLETALPKVGGNAIVLTGRHRLQKGKLLERHSDTGRGVIQVFEDMNVVKLSLDDMAEWCGPLDDDMEL